MRDYGHGPDDRTGDKLMRSLPQRQNRGRPAHLPLFAAIANDPFITPTPSQLPQKCSPRCRKFPLDTNAPDKWVPSRQRVATFLIRQGRSGNGTADWFSARHEPNAERPCCIPYNSRGGPVESSHDAPNPQCIPHKVVKGGSLSLCAKLLPALSTGGGSRADDR